MAGFYWNTVGYVPYCRDEGRAYAKRLAAAGVEVEDRHYPKAYHGQLICDL